MNRAEKLRQKKLADKALKLMQTVSPDIAEQQQTLTTQQAIDLTNTRKLKQFKLFMFRNDTISVQQTA